ncbi:PSD1 and planctomycete cytochrome C domain-containing protein [Thalassoroseus pseudoceratinae]|uniref:PSD1 and planctomycete cytochrome C domain-containing protein n=1 Tax=Thalassoroseus pseudoceratinae TaxID=2713176 RepID=UPI00141D99ED|nr:PSD1 and planctomycete cytochrome C domain-containing protein [Thalassoroseus pseudoceratinae]
MPVLRLLSVWLFIFALILDGTLSAANNETLTYEKDIRPIFREHCFDCHGATEELEGNLDLRLVRFMKKGGDAGPAIVPGDPNGSYLLDRLHDGDMPPGEGKIPDEQIQTIEHWIAGGAKTSRPEPETIGPGLGITLEERSFWSFQPIQRPTVPAIESFPKDARVRTGIDAVIQSVPDAQSFAPDADRRVLIVRAYFNLIGLPPSPEELHKWLSHSDEDWYDQLLTELLDSPHYGERWARHWLDVAGYADSEGYTTADADRPWAWKYRDWVIRALNADMPFDQFITEQLAGDELMEPRKGDLTPRQIDLLTATGFLRMAADGTGSGANNVDGRNQVMIDTLKIVGTSLLGLSVQCAQCHDHRYDPIPQTDYYALRAVFEPALDWQAWKTPRSRLVSLYTEADRKKAAEVEAAAQKIAKEKSQKQTEYMNQALEQELKKFDEPLQTKLREAYRASTKERTDEQKALLKKYPSVNITPGVLYQYLPEAAKELKTFDTRIQEVRAKKPAEQFIRALVEPAGHAPDTKLFHRGDPGQPKQTVRPRALTVATPEDKSAEFPLNSDSRPTTGRRLAFAKWLTNPKNPLFARVIVNRVWMHHFGKGLVSTPADFGKLGNVPSHPELLDFLADEFMRSGWSLKSLHRLILNSTACRQVRDVDSDFRPGLTRLDAEIIRDRMLAVSGKLDHTLFGKPLQVKEDETGQVVVDGEQTRRSIYIRQQRSRPLAMLQTFDAPVMETNCEVRTNSTVATQSLMLLNGEFILNQSAKLAQRAIEEAKPLSESQLAALTEIAELPTTNWQYGFGSFDEAGNRTENFSPLSHWTGTQWQAGPTLPDPNSGWVLLNAQGGHPDVPNRAVIRRWIAPHDATISIEGKLSHGSPHGDGVRGRVVSSRHGKLGEWSVHNSTTVTSIASTDIKAGDQIDFITDCRESITSDSFSWPLTIQGAYPQQAERTVSSSKAFQGPPPTKDSLAGQVIRVWELAFCRQPSQDELATALDFLSRQINLFQDSPEFIAKNQTAHSQALTSLCQVVFSSNEFLYIE